MSDFASYFDGIRKAEQQVGATPVPPELYRLDTTPAARRAAESAYAAALLSKPAGQFTPAEQAYLQTELRSWARGEE